MSAVNKVRLIGNLGQDVNYKDLGNGRQLARVTMATNSVYYSKDGEKKQETQWHTLVGWNKMADRMRRILAKGKKISIDGKLVYNEYEKDNVKHQRAEIVLEEIVLM